MVTSQCFCCRRCFTPKRNPQQRYCSQNDCQKARKNAWRRQKHAFDPDYQDANRTSNKKWRDKNPGYQSAYRATHPEYTERNRVQSHHRKQSHDIPDDASEFVKSDALISGTSIIPGTYRLLALGTAEDKFVKSDALIVEISLISKSCDDTNVVCKETPYRQAVF